MIVRSSFTKVISESPVFLERIHGDICRPIHPPCGPFLYFMILIETFTKWSHFCLLLHVMLPLLGSLHKWLNYEHNFQIIRLRQYILIMLMNLLLKHSLTILHVIRDKYWASCCSYPYPKWLSRILYQTSPINNLTTMKTKLPTFA